MSDKPLTQAKLHATRVITTTRTITKSIVKLATMVEDFRESVQNVDEQEPQDLVHLKEEVRLITEANQEFEAACQKLLAAAG